MNLGKLLEETYSNCGFVKLRGVATGGTTQTIVDSSLATRYSSNAFKRHIAFISETTDGAAPEGQYKLLNATGTYTAATWTINLPSVVTAAVGAGDIYSIMKPTIELYEMIQQINAAMGKLPAVRLEDTSLTASASTLEYTLPIATKKYPLQDVHIGNATDGWKRFKNYEVRPASEGSTETLVFLSQPPYDADTSTNQTIKLTYLGKQTSLNSYDDSISEKYADELVYAVCAYTALNYHITKKNLLTNKRWVAKLGVFQQRYYEALRDNPVRVPPSVQPRTVNLRDI